MTTIDDKTETEQRSDDSLKSQEAPGCSQDSNSNPPKQIKKCRLPIFIKRKKQKLSTVLSPTISVQPSVLTISQSLSCHLLDDTKPVKHSTLPKLTSEESIQVEITPTPKKAKVSGTVSAKPLPKLSKEIQVGGRTTAFDLYTTQTEFVPPISGDSLRNNTSSVISTTSSQLPSSSSSSVANKSIPKKRSISGTSSSHLPKKVATTKKYAKPPGPLSKNSIKPLQVPSTISGVNSQSPPKPISITNSSQTIESWPVIQKRLNIFEKAKKKLSGDRGKPKVVLSKHVQATLPLVERADVKCSVYVEQGHKTTLARIAPNGMERVESCMNTEINNSNSGIQCDIVMRKKITTKRTIRLLSNENVTRRKDDVPEKPNEDVVSDKSNPSAQATDLVTVLPTKVVDPRVTRSDNAYIDQNNSEMTLEVEDPIHCLNEFLSLECMLHRLQDEIRGLDKTIRQISNNYHLPSTTSPPPFENANQDFEPNSSIPYRSYSYNN